MVPLLLRVPCREVVVHVRRPCTCTTSPFRARAQQHLHGEAVEPPITPPRGRCGPRRRITLANGESRPIKDVREGDMVMATDPETGETGAREVIATLPHTDQLLTLKTSAGDIITTEDHRYWNETDQAWQESQDLDEGDRLLTADGDQVTVEGLDWSTVHTDDAYDLDVADLDSFYVGAGDESVLVHNQDPCRVPYGAGGNKPPRAPSYRDVDGGMSPTRDRALERANEALDANQSGRLRLEDSPTDMHVHVDVYNNHGELLETIHFPFQRR